MPPSLSFIKLGQPGDPPHSGTVEVHWDTLQGDTYKRAGDYPSDFSPADAANGTWQLFADGDGLPPVLGFIKLRNVGNPAGMVEVHWATLQGKVYKRAGDYVSDFSVNDADNGVWQLIGLGGNQPPILGFIKLSHVGNLAGMVEVHLDALQGGSGGSYVRIANVVSDFSTADAPNGVWQLPVAGNMNAEGSPFFQISFIKLQKVGNLDKLVEVHIGEFTSVPIGPPWTSWDYRRTVNVPSDFRTEDAANGVWTLFSYPGIGTALGFIKLLQVPNPPGTVEFHIDQQENGPNGPYTRLGQDFTSDFSQADANNGVWGAF